MNFPTTVRLQLVVSTKVSRPDFSSNDDTYYNRLGVKSIHNPIHQVIDMMVETKWKP